MTDMPIQEGRKRRGGLFVHDTEICERLGIPEREGMRTIRALDADKRSGFPPQLEAFAGRRYWPAVQDYFDKAYGLQAQHQPLVRSVPQRRTA